MPHETALLLNLAAAFAVAFVFGFAASRVGLPPLAGYLMAGVMLGPHAPGFTGDVQLAGQLAEIGVVLLMFGVGLHFSPGDLARVRRIALPGALVQMLVATALGTALALLWSWELPAAIVFGCSLSVASTVVVFRVLEARGLLDSSDGRLAVGWLVVEDLGVIVVLVLLPAILSGAGANAGTASTHVSNGAMAWVITTTLLKVVAFIALMGLAGRRAVPWLLMHVARSGSRELFTLAVLAISLGVAVGAASFFGVSIALGAFVAGVVISESDLSHRAAADALPMQDAFAVLFFVSVGMLIDPSVFVQQPGRIAASVGTILVGNSLVASMLMVLLRHPLKASLRLGASLGQIGEFSFILAGLGVSMGVLPEAGRSLILASAFATIVLNPIVFAGMTLLGDRLSRRHRFMAWLEQSGGPPVTTDDSLSADVPNHAIVIGYGRVGRTIGDALLAVGMPFVAIEQDRRVAEAVRASGVNTIYGDATRPGILSHAKPALAKLLVIASPDPYHARHVISLVRASNPAIDIVVRTHSDQEQALFESMGVTKALMGERELAFAMAYHSLRSLGCDDDRADEIVSHLHAGPSA